MHPLHAIVPCLAIAFASPTYEKGYTCEEFLVDVPVNTTSIVLPVPPIENKYQAVAYGQLLGTPVAGDSPPPETSQLVKTFQISGEYCVPKEPGPKASTLQILTHGLGYNRTYWDFYVPGSENPQYSHLHAATAAGYSTISYNRLGISPSTIADPYTEIQALTSAHILIGITKLARDGKIPGMTAPPKYIIHVGHSHGSQISIGTAALAPEISDGLVITGLNGNPSTVAIVLGTLGFRIANQVEPVRFPKETYSNGWLVWQTEQDNQYVFFTYPTFKPEVLAHAEAVKHPFTLGEIFGASALPIQASAYKNPVLWLASEHDVVCSFDCNNDFEKDGPAFTSFNGSDDVSAFIVPGAGHALPLHENVTVGYEKLDAWIQERWPAN